MVTRSREEVHLCARLLHILQFLGFKCTVDTLLQGLQDGAKNNLFDFVLSFRNITFYFEYDGGHYHDSERVSKDEEKSKKLLKQNPNAVLIRLRVNAPPLNIDDDRCLCPVVDSNNCNKNAVVVAHALAKLPVYPEDIKKRLSQVQVENYKIANGIAEDAIKMLDKRYKQQLQKLEEFFGKVNAHKVRRVHGVVKLLEHDLLISACQTIQSLFKFTTKQLVTLMSNSVASRVTDPVFVNALKSLKTDMAFTTEQLVTLMSSDSVASRITKPEFIDAMIRLKSLDISFDQFVMIVADNGSRLMDPIFKNIIEELQESKCLTQKKLRNEIRKRKRI